MAAILGSLTQPAIAASIKDDGLAKHQVSTHVIEKFETIFSIAERHGVSVENLKSINSANKAGKNFYELSEGDIINVPALPSLSSHSSEKTQSSVNGDGETGGASYITDTVSNLGGALASQEGVQQVAGIVANSATNMANQEVGKAFQQFGASTTRVNINNKFNLDGSSLDFLMPIYDKNNFLLFGQNGIRKKNDRTTWNIGVGARRFLDDRMFGVNTFFDYDLTGGNKRWGIGGEAWGDYIKLSANSYFRISDWHQSRDFSDYNERPASGFDMHIEKYFRSHPQLGAKLSYEQYYGNNVSLFGKSNLQRNPSGLTFGLNYTPVPLVSLGVAHKQGQGGHRETQFQIDLTYNFGTSWKKQTDPNAVAALRTLSGARYDLVDRNNSIVLDYMKQDVIKLTLPQKLTGATAETIRIAAQLASKYGVEKIQWDTAAILAAGGSVNQTTKTTLDIILPPYQQKNAGNNLYSLSAVAFDTRGNKSNRATTLVVVKEPDAESVITKLIVTSNNAVANGIDSNAVQAQITDKAGAPLSGQRVNFTASNGATVTTVTGTTGPDGLANATLTNTTAGNTLVTVTLDSGVKNTINTNFIPDSASDQIQTIVVVDDNALANGSDTNSVQVKVTNNSGNPIAGHSVKFTSKYGGIIIDDLVVTDASGLANAKVSRTTPGVELITATLDNGFSKSIGTSFIAAVKVEIVTTRDGAIGNKVDLNEVEATVLDANGAPLVGVSVSFYTNSSSVNFSATYGTTDNFGKVKTDLSANSGDYEIKAYYGNIASAPTKVNFIRLNQKFERISEYSNADGVSENIYAFTVTFPDGSPVVGYPVGFSLDPNDPFELNILERNVLTDSNGIAYARITSTQPADDHTLIVQVAGCCTYIVGGVYFL